MIYQYVLKTCILQYLLFIKCSISVGVMLANLDFYLKLLRGLGVLVTFIQLVYLRPSIICIQAS